MTNYAAAPISRNAIRSLANQIRLITGFDTQPYFPILEFFELMIPKAIKDFNYEIVAKKEMPEKHGETFPSQKLIRLREDIYLGANRGNGRDRFTIAHEIGHLLLHQNNNVSLYRLEPHTRLKPYEDPEWQANAFAGELLMPIDIIKDMSIDQIRKQCVVSADAARYQFSLLKSTR